jgi:hypothetical protein
MMSIQNNSTKVNAQSNLFDKIIDNESLPSIAPDKFLESKGSFAPNAPPGADTGTFDLMARFGPVIVYSDNIKNYSNSIDFDKVPATTPPDFMKFMPPYQALFYVFNTEAQNITINAIRISEVISKETESPFDFCGINYNNTSIPLSLNYTQTFSICYFPKVAGNSTAKLDFYQGSRLIFDIPLKGNGISPASMQGDTGMINKVSNKTNDKNINFTEKDKLSNITSKMPMSILNLTSDTQSFLIKPLEGCSVKIEGGGQRPDPAVSGFDPTNRAPIDPPDDGLNANDRTGSHHRINVGQLVKLKAEVSGIPLESIQNIRWTVSEPKIKDYNESIPGKFAIYMLKDQDYLKPAISFYWKDDGNKEVTVTVEVINGNQSKKCESSRTFTVERNNNDLNRQATDFYIFNHNATVLEKHFNWHMDNPQPIPCDPSNNGEKFFLFHKAVISNFDTWRDTFGYPKVIPWDPATNPPNSTEFDNKNRGLVYTSQRIPSFYTTEGGRTNSYCSPLYHQNITKLSDYKNSDFLGSELERTWHGVVHMAIAGDNGDMGDFSLAPKDPVFWMWHKYIDSVYDKYREIKDLN